MVLAPHLPGFYKSIPLKSNMKHVVKYDVYLEILPMVSIYAITYSLLRDNSNIQKSRFRDFGLGGW